MSRNLLSPARTQSSIHICLSILYVPWRVSKINGLSFVSMSNMTAKCPQLAACLRFLLVCLLISEVKMDRNDDSLL
jgi:hypothetical protein